MLLLPLGWIIENALLLGCFNRHKQAPVQNANLCFFMICLPHSKGASFSLVPRTEKVIAGAELHSYGTAF